MHLWSAGGPMASLTYKPDAWLAADKGDKQEVSHMSFIIQQASLSLLTE